jgi:hypothetical protein
MKETVRFSTPGDAERLAPLLRPEDVSEVLAAGMSSPLEALEMGFENSKLCVSVEEADGTMAMMWGVVPSMTDPLFGYIWLLGSDFITRKPKTFLQHSKPFLTALHQVRPVLGNFVHASNTVHVRWLRWLGFSFINTVKGPDGSDFLEFVRVQHV